MEGIKGFLPPVALGVLGGISFFSSGLVTGAGVAAYFFSSGFYTAVYGRVVLVVLTTAVKPPAASLCFKDLAIGSSSSLSAGFLDIFFSSMGYLSTFTAVCGRGILVIGFFSPPPTTAVTPPTASLCLMALAIGSSSSAFSTGFLPFFSSGFAPAGFALGEAFFFSSSF